MAHQVHVLTAVEGIVDEAVLGTLIGMAGATMGGPLVQGGKQNLLPKLPAFNKAAAHYPWAVLVDLDHDADCAPPARERWLSEPAAYMCFRVAVRAVEAWLLADRERLARFLSVAEKHLPVEPEAEDDPKGALVTAARRSRRRVIRDELVPRPGSGRTEGEGYAGRVSEFATDYWSPRDARERSESLRRAIECLQRLAGGSTRD